MGMEGERNCQEGNGAYRGKARRSIHRSRREAAARGRKVRDAADGRGGGRGNYQGKVQIISGMRSCRKKTEAAKEMERGRSVERE